MNYEHFSDRLVESIAMVRELLQNNKEIREENEFMKKKLDLQENELFQL